MGPQELSVHMKPARRRERARGASQAMPQKTLAHRGPRGRVLEDLQPQCKLTPQWAPHKHPRMTLFLFLSSKLRLSQSPGARKPHWKWSCLLQKNRPRGSPSQAITRHRQTKTGWPQVWGAYLSGLHPQAPLLVPDPHSKRKGVKMCPEPRDYAEWRGPEGERRATVKMPDATEMILCQATCIRVTFYYNFCSFHMCSTFSAHADQMLNPLWQLILERSSYALSNSWNRLRLHP